MRGDKGTTNYIHCILFSWELVPGAPAKAVQKLPGHSDHWSLNRNHKFMAFRLQACSFQESTLSTRTWNDLILISANLCINSLSILLGLNLNLLFHWNPSNLKTSCCNFYLISQRTEIESIIYTDFLPELISLSSFMEMEFLALCIIYMVKVNSFAWISLCINNT